MKNPHTFLLDQPIFRANARNLEARWLAAIDEREPRDRRRGDGFQSALNPHIEDTQPQEHVFRRLNRNKLVEGLASLDNATSRWGRGVLICPSGLGKTTNFRWLEAAINRHANYGGKQLAFYLEVADLIAQDAESLLQMLVVRMRNLLGSVWSEAQLTTDLLRRRQQGHITLLLDSLDQAGADPTGPAVKAIRDLLGGVWQHCPIWVSGRPSAFKDNRSMFLDGAAWKCLRAGQLDPPESRFMLDEIQKQRKRRLGLAPEISGQPTNLYDQLSPAAQKLAQIPRIARLIGNMSPERARNLSQTATRADVYWEVYTYDTATKDDKDCGLLADGLKVPNHFAWRVKDQVPPWGFRQHQIGRALDLLGAIAFEMLCKIGPDGKPQAAWNGIAENLDDFKKAVRLRFVNAGALVDDCGKEEYAGFFTTDLDYLLKMDSHHLQHFIFSSDHRDKKLQFTDRDTMAFFAACWGCRWATAEELEVTRQWVVDSKTSVNEQFRDFWLFGVEIPVECFRNKRPTDAYANCDIQKWIDLFAPLYDSSICNEDGPIRSTEFIYRSWKRMEAWSAAPLQTFLQEFQDICAGKLGSEKKKLAEELLAVGPREANQGFISLGNSGMELDTGTFMMGASGSSSQSTPWKASDEEPDEDRLASINPEHLVTLSPYLLHRYCVTNMEYELFDPRHKKRRWTKSNEHPLVKMGQLDDRLPTVNVSWFDGWCFTQWLGQFKHDNRAYKVVLPSEAQWEYGCRCGQNTPFTFDQSRNGKTCMTEFCNCMPFDDPNPIYREHTLRVDAMLPNIWGFFHMHGNVWEWCLDWFDETFYQAVQHNPVCEEPARRRVFRGGGWKYGSRLCESTWRSGFEPVFEVTYVGFRLCAIPTGPSTYLINSSNLIGLESAR